MEAASMDCETVGDAGWTDAYDDKDAKIGTLQGRDVYMRLELTRQYLSAHQHVVNPFIDTAQFRIGKLRCHFDSDPSYPSEPKGADEDPTSRAESREREYYREYGQPTPADSPAPNKKEAQGKDRSNQEQPKKESNTKCQGKVGAELDDGDVIVTGKIIVTTTDEDSSQVIEARVDVNPQTKDFSAKIEATFDF